MLNKAILMGRMVQNPELKYTPSNIPVVSFTIAVNRNFKDQDGQYPTDFLDCVAWRNTAEFVSKYFQKGSLCALEGTIQTRMWEDKNGNKRKAVEIIADNVYFAESKKNSDNIPSNYEPDINAYSTEDEFEEVGNDELTPF